MAMSAIALFFILWIPVAYAGEELNAGFVNGLWFSRYPFFASETTRIYAALQNNSSFDIKGKAAFFDKGEKIGEANFSVVNGRLLEVWTDWRVEEGAHTISVSIIEAFKIEVGKNPEPIVLAFASFAQEPLVVEKDTDGDLTGDRSDADDDNDGLSDSKEKEYGTNPLTADSDGDGISDKKEISGGTDPLKSPSQKQDQDAVAPNVSLRDKASTTVALLQEVRQTYAPRVIRAVKQTMESIDTQADYAAKIIRTKKDNLEPTQYKSLFVVSLALLLPLVEYWRISLVMFAAMLLWLLWRRVKRGRHA